MDGGRVISLRAWPCQTNTMIGRVVSIRTWSWLNELFTQARHHKYAITLEPIALLPPPPLLDTFSVITHKLPLYPPTDLLFQYLSYFIIFPFIVVHGADPAMETQFPFALCPPHRPVDRSLIAPLSNLSPPPPPGLVIHMMKNESAVLFVIDTSGSMCVTTAVDGRLTLRGDRTKDMRRLLEEGVRAKFQPFLCSFCLTLQVPRKVGLTVLRACVGVLQC